VSPEAPLGGLRVVEVGQYVAAPFAATLFADLGAEVVKIERPGGDPYRAHPARFAAWNRGKHSVVLDLAAAEGRAEALRLVDEADVVIENLRPGALEQLGLDLGELRARRPSLVTCSISAYGRTGPARHDPGWEPLVHGRAGAQQGLMTADRPVWLPFPMASVAAGLLAVLGVGAALVKRETTGYGQHVETSLFEALLFLNGGQIFHRPRHRPPVVRNARSPILRVYETADGRGIQVNLSGTERWRELCRLVGLDGDGGLDFADPRSLVKLGDPAWCEDMATELATRFASRTAAEWEAALLDTPAAASTCRTLEEWLAHEQAQANGLLIEVDQPDLGPLAVVGPPIRLRTAASGARPSARRGTESGALAGHRVIDISSFWAGPLAARLLAELGADVVKVEPPGGEGAYQIVPILPNIYMDANRSKRGLTLDLREEEDRRRLLELVEVADVVVENAVAGTWERLDLGEDHLRKVNPALVYARAKGFGLEGPLAPRPSFDYVVQAATGMEMTQGRGDPQPVNFTANDYCTGIHLAVGIVLALLARARGVAVASVDASLMMTATVFQSEHVALAGTPAGRGDEVGEGLGGPTPGCHLYEAQDGWVVVCAASPDQEAALGRALAVDELSVEAIAAAVAGWPVPQVIDLLGRHGVPAAASVHPRAVPDDPQMVVGTQLATVRHPASGRFVQVGVPLWLSEDTPAVKGPAPAPVRHGRPAARR